MEKKKLALGRIRKDRGVKISGHDAEALIMAFNMWAATAARKLKPVDLVLHFDPERGWRARPALGNDKHWNDFLDGNPFAEMAWTHRVTTDCRWTALAQAVFGAEWLLDGRPEE